MEIEGRPSPNQRAGRNGQRPRAVVLHTTDGTFNGTVAWFSTEESAVSAHYLIGLDGRIVSFVGEEDTALHAGRVHEPTSWVGREPDPNEITIGIEFEDGGDPSEVQRPSLQMWTGAAVLRGISRRWDIPLDREHVVGHREIFSKKSCPGNLDIDRLLRNAGRAFSVVALLPVRNGEADLPGYLESARGFADAVIALDDGSTDGTSKLLEEDPLVEIVLRNEPRESAAGWDDARNRRRLLSATELLSPRWVVWLDADERIESADAIVLRSFLERDALPGLAYGLRLHRMWDDECDPGYRYVYRVHGFEPDQSLPGERLHFNPVPEEIPRRAWLRTTIRVQHLGSSTPGRIEARRKKYAEADPEEEFPYDAELEPPKELVPWAPRAGDEPVLAPPPRHRLVCLLPVRNGETDLPGYFESARRFADAIVALDDGSTDSTPELLEVEPLVKMILANPQRPTHAGWDDAANRERLLRGAGELDPEFVMWLDADERISEDDAQALRRFVDEEALPDYAYLMQVVPVRGDGYGRPGIWVGRLFAYEPVRDLGPRFHQVPIPPSIPRSHWLQTTIRIQHLGGSDPTRRRERYEKYAEADPEGHAEGYYENLLTDDGDVRPWEPRKDDLAVLVGAAPLRLPGEDESVDLDAPVLSAIVIARNDAATIARTVSSVVTQECDLPFEVIVVTSGTDGTANVVRSEFPDVKVIDLGEKALPGAARNAGVLVARGDYVSFPGSHVELPPGSLNARIHAHLRGYPMVTGTILNGTTTRSGWASYFLDHSNALPGRTPEELKSAPAHCSYDREILLRSGLFPEDMRAGEDTVVNTRLWEEGYRALRDPGVTLYHHSHCTNSLKLVRHHFTRGRAWGRILAERGWGYAPLVRYLPKRLERTSDNVAEYGGDLRDTYRRVKPLVIAGATAAWLGAIYERTLRLRRPRSF